MKKFNPLKLIRDLFPQLSGIADSVLLDNAVDLLDPRKSIQTIERLLGR